MMELRITFDTATGYRRGRARRMIRELGVIVEQYADDIDAVLDAPTPAGPPARPKRRAVRAPDRMKGRTA